MSRHYKAEDVEREIERLLRFRDENDFDLGIKHGIETVKSVLKDLPTIEAGEDCISREYLKSFEYINKGDFNSVETIREWIDTAPSVIPKAKEGEWIPCSERLPNEGEVVLVCMRIESHKAEWEEQRSIEFGRISSDRYDYNGTGWEWLNESGADYWQADWNNSILAWMPLPKPWKAAPEEEMLIDALNAEIVVKDMNNLK